MKRLKLTDDRSLDGEQYLAGEHELADDVAARLLANFPKVASEVKPSKPKTATTKRSGKAPTSRK